MNDSSTGGPLAPTSAAVSDDDALDDVFQALVAGITGIAGALVRPRYQAEPPNLPAFATDWCAIGVVDRRPADTYPFVKHDGAANGGRGQDVLVRHEELIVRASFYGPNAGSNAALLRDGLAIKQNLDPLFEATPRMQLAYVGDAERAPELLKNKMTNRWDFPFTVRRAVVRTYPVLNIVEADGTLEANVAHGDVITDPIKAT